MNSSTTVGRSAGRRRQAAEHEEKQSKERRGFAHRKSLQPRALIPSQQRVNRPARLVKPEGGLVPIVNHRRRGRCAMELKDPKLFRQQCYVDGEWVDALNRGTIPVTNPATGETLGTVPRMGAEETRQAIEAADTRAARLARQDRQGARADPAQMVRPDDGEPGGSRHADDRRAGQAAGRVEGRDRLCRRLHRVVRRGGQAHLRRHDPGARRRQAHRRHQGADRRLRRDHAVELPGGDDHPQRRARPWPPAARWC